MLNQETTEKLAEVVEEVAASGERVIFRRGDRIVGALISAEDLARLEELEDRSDVEESERRLTDPRQASIPLAEVRRRLGL